jgi:hypothetical protein
VQSITASIEQQLEIVADAVKNNDTVIFRYNGTNPGNLKPRMGESALSFKLVPHNGSWVTTVNAVNSTGVLFAKVDGPDHCSIYPIGGTMQEWALQGVNSIWTIA